jgi:high-affinity nickel-transport protein
MIPLLSVLGLGFFLGMRHATDADHVIAVSTIVSRERTVTAAALIGILWGIGHTLTILMVGGSMILFNVIIPPRIGLTMELSVGLMLILLGVLNLTGIFRWIADNVTSQSHRHSHGDRPVDHGHAEEGGAVALLDRRFGRLGLYQILRPLIVGVVHGLAGSAAVALLVLTTIRNPMWGLAYLLVFGGGTIAGMMLITAAIALPFAYTLKRFVGVNRSLAVASGLLSLGFGLFLVYQIGFIDGLFSGHPRWTPE